MKFVRDHFVPVALNLYKIRADKGPGGDFFKSVQKQRPAQYQGLYLVAPDGKVLASHQQFKSPKTWAEEVLADLKPGLKTFGKVTPRQAPPVNPLPHRGVGVQAGGSVTLAVTDRLVLVKDLAKEPPPGTLGALVPDSIILSAKAWSSLTSPAKMKVGTTWTVPEATARQFFPLLSISDTVFRDAKEVTAVELVGRVDEIDGDVATIHYSGHISGVHHGSKDEAKLGNKVSAEAKLLSGVATYDVKAGKLLSLTLVYDGQYRNWSPYDQPVRFGSVVEWRQAAARP